MSCWVCEFRVVCSEYHSVSEDERSSIGVTFLSIETERLGNSALGSGSFPTPVSFRVEQPFFDEFCHGAREISLAVVKLRCKLENCVTGFDGGEDSNSIRRITV